MRDPRSILITGASSGIGEALAELYAAPGVTLALTGRAEAILQPKQKQAEFFASTGRVPDGTTGGTAGVQVETTTDVRSRGAAPLVLIDLAVPRDIDPAVAELHGVEVYTLDDLRPLVDGTIRQRRAELPAAHAVLSSEVTRYTTWLRRRELVAA